MLQGMTAYLAETAGEIRGVFREEREARETGAGSVREILLRQLPGSPAECGWAVMAEGSMGLVTAVDGEIRAETLQLGPVWGVNVQSAVAGLFGPSYRRTVELDRLVMVEIGRDYAQDRLLVFDLFNGFREVAEQIGRAGAIPQDVLTRDYLGNYFREARQAQERLSASAILECEMIAEHLMNRAQEKAGKGGATFLSAALLEQAQIRLENRLHNIFTPDELKCLAWQLGLTKEKPREAESVPEQRQAMLKARVDKLMPALKRQRRRIDDMEDLDGG